MAGSAGLGSPRRDVTLALQAAASGDAAAAAALLPMVYEELHRLAQARLRRTPPGNTLQTTALIHEAYLRLVGEGDPGWSGRHHFFGAAARAMRDILVDQARRKSAAKHGGQMRRVDLDESDIVLDEAPERLLALDEALRKLEGEDARLGEIVMLRYFAGLTQAETAAALGVSERTIERDWRYIRAWLRRELGPGDGADG
ncbi:MAG: sigma-70 family RNA polymerase sigma factor [Phycisphaerales bacterium]|nr:sigma-70 family RNA polymerase sigma factor [Phycisphaerales bacterium]